MLRHPGREINGQDRRRDEICCRVSAGAGRGLPDQPNPIDHCRRRQAVDGVESLAGKLASVHGPVQGRHLPIHHDRLHDSFFPGAIARVNLGGR